MKKQVHFSVLATLCGLLFWSPVVAQNVPAKKPALATQINTDTDSKNDKQAKPTSDDTGSKNPGKANDSKKNSGDNKSNTAGKPATTGKPADTPREGKPAESGKPTTNPEQPAETPGSVAQTKRQLIADGYVVCTEHPKFGLIYCQEDKGKYVYIDSDGIPIPVKKSIVLPEAEKAQEKPNSKPADKPVDIPTHKDKNVPTSSGLSKKNKAEFNNYTYMIADWALTESEADNTGKQQAAMLNKTTLRDGALWCAGNTGGDPYANAVLTPVLTGLNLSNFEIQVDFNATRIQQQPILVIGTGCRWLGAEMDADGILYLLVNNSDRTAGVTWIRSNTWQNMRLKYKNGTAQLFLNGTLYCSKTVGLDWGPCGINDTKISTANHSNAAAFTGYVRNLRVFSY